MGLTTSFYEQTQFQSENFVTELFPDKFLLFLLWSQGFNKPEDIEKLAINTEPTEERDEHKIYIEVRIANNSLKEGVFGTYSKTGTNSHFISYKRLFNKRFANTNYLNLIQLYDEVTIGKANNSQLEVLIKQQVLEAFDLFTKPKTVIQSFIPLSEPSILDENETEKLVAFYRLQNNEPVSASKLQLLLKQLFHINTKVEFKNKQLEINYHPDGIGLDDPNQKYRLGYVVLDSYVKYSDVVAEIHHQLIQESEIIFNSKVDYIRLEQKQNEQGHITDVLIPLTNSTQDNYIVYSCNGMKVQFPSCIYAYTIQLVKNKIELLYKLQQSNNYISLNLEYGEEISICEKLFYSLDKSGKLIYVDDNYPDKIVATHNVKVRVFESDSILRIQTEEVVFINTERYYHKYLKDIIEKKINYILDIFLPVIYERNIDLN